MHDAPAHGIETMHRQMLQNGGFCIGMAELQELGRTHGLEQRGLGVLSMGI